MGYVTLDNVTALAQTVIKDADDRDRNIWKAWTYECMLQLGIGDDEIKVVDLFPQNFVSALPPDCRYIIEFSLFDDSGSQLKHLHRTGKLRMYTDQRIAPVSATSSSDVNDCIPVDVSTDATNIHLGTNGDQVARILLRYFAYPLDENGDPLIREEDSMAIVYFIRYMQGLRQDDNRSKIEQDQRAYYMEADRAKARKKMKSMSPDKAYAVLSGMTSLLPNFRSLKGF